MMQSWGDPVLSRFCFVLLRVLVQPTGKKTNHFFRLGHNAVIVTANNDDFPQGENVYPGRKKEDYAYAEG